VVAAAGKVRKGQLTAAIRSLDQTNSKVIGVVVTMLPSKGPDSYGGTEYSYYGGRAESPTQPPKNRRRRNRK
jgi:Mrp family chromosome partitioning ATPase